MKNLLHHLCISVCIISLLFSSEVHAQKSITAHPVNNSITIDGDLSEADWKQHIKPGNFIQITPENGAASKRKTHIGVLYTDSYLYVAAVLYIDDPKEVNKQLTARDDLGASDFFGMQIDPFGEAREGYDFSVTAAGVQFDEKLSSNNGYLNFNVVWNSAVQQYEDRWVVEMRIPFNSIRFPKDKLDNFRINFQRFTGKLNEESFWNPIDPEVNGYLNQFGKLEGLPVLQPPLNLSFYPFVSVVNEKSPEGDNNTSFNGGLDVKYVYDNAYTLDVSLIPDFSQAQSDDQIFNLSPFEIKFDENRQFFVEGTEIFDKGGYLYTRRIGGTPLDKNNIQVADNEEITTNPVSSNILNLIKFTGKGDNGLSIGVLNGITAKSEAIIKNTETDETRTVITNPLTNYNSLVLDQALKNNSSFTLINNSVFRSGSTYDANLTALQFRGYTKERTYSVLFKKALSQRYSSGGKAELGHEYFGFIGKVGGKWRGGISTRLYDEKFDTNDFGFLPRNNQLTFTGDLSYTENNPENSLSRYRFAFLHRQRFYYSLMEREQSFFKFQTNGTFKESNHSYFADFTYIDKGQNFFEARTPDMPFIIPAQTEVFLEYQTNRNKNLSFAGYFVYVDYIDSNIFDYEYIGGYGIRARMGQHLFAYWAQSIEYKPNNAGFIDSQDDAILFGQRSIQQLVNRFQLEYTLNAKMSLNVRLRHYWIQVDYKDQFTLQQDGSLASNDFDIPINEFDDNFNQFNIDVIARWQFAPASEISLGYKLGANSFNTDVSTSYFDNFSDVTSADNSQTLSLKMTYFLDVNRFKKS